MYTEPHTTPWAGLHTFIVHLGPQSCRCPGLLSEAAFDCVMDALNWRMPYHLRAFHCSSPETAAANPVLRAMPEFSAPLEAVLFTAPAAPMRLKDKRRKQTLSVRSKYGDYALAETEDGYGRLYHVDGITSSLIVRLEACPITLQEASAYVEAHHRHNAGPKFHKFSLCLRAPGEAEPVGVAIASIPKARCQMDGLTLEINRCCADPRYADVCSNLYARTIRIGREMGYLRAVRKYLARPELRAYQFSTIAFRAMSCDVHHSREYWLRGKRCGRIVQTLNDDQNADDLRDSVTESVDNVIQFEAYTSTLTPLQQRIAELRDIGYSDREISAICGIPYKVVALEMEGAKRSILEVYIGDAPRAA